MDSSQTKKEPSLKKLEYYSLVSKVCTELESHLGFTDKTLAEFITSLGRKCHSVDEFDLKLKENGAEMPDYFVRTLLTIIHAILPPKTKVNLDKDKDGGGKPGWKALNIGDTKDRVKELEKEIEMEAKEKKRRDVANEDYPDDSSRGRRGHRDRDRDGRSNRDGDRDRDRERDYRGGGRNGDRYDRDERGGWTFYSTANLSKLVILGLDYMRDPAATQFNICCFTSIPASAMRNLVCAAYLMELQQCVNMPTVLGCGDAEEMNRSCCGNVKM